MRKTLRLVLAAVTGAAVISSGAAITVASPANALAVSIGTITVSDNFVPPSGSDKMPFKFTITEPPFVEGKAPKVTAVFYKEGEATSGAGTAATVNAIANLSSATATPPATLDVTGSIPIASSDKPTTTGKWTIKVSVAGDATPAPNPVVRDDPFEVAKATRVTSASVDPSTVKLKSGSDIDVYAAFKLERGGAASDEKVTDVRLESKDSDDYYSLNTGLESDDSYHDSTSMDYDTTAGAWQLKVSVTRGSKTYAFVKGFTVTKGTSGKAKSKITLVASPSKVKKGKATKLYGKVYRGYTSWGAWKKKILKLYFKKKGTKTWKFVGYVGSNSSGKFSKSVKPKYDGYWRLGATATSTTKSAWSPSKFVDVR
ncbi:hypothetical protein GCM10009555_040400 [Acrocarpospora macrocephala]|uniref:Uncharacterized protein n=1 Tax=Acrocarpospora macrocephala TaxID=150177 RepID=A0A5M3WL32_9ACTN|nr:hypothetical protein [Acrocarpospora macrocephala]GES09987.1 hypothetical protein Amac_035830 [Acrocarpospora macrocephala]